MTTSDPGADTRIRVDEGSALARYAEWHGRAKGRAIAAIGTGRRDATLFVADEVLVNGDDRELVEELVRRYSAEVIPDPPIPPMPIGLRRDRRTPIDGMPHTMRLRFPAPPRVDDAARVLEAAAAQRHVRDRALVVTSEMAATVCAVVARHAPEGRSIGLNHVGIPAGMPLDVSQEASSFGSIGSDAMQWPTFAGPIRMAEAWQLIESARLIRGDQFIVIAILDGGFWLDASGAPLFPAAQGASDFGAGVMQLNLQNEGAPAGGMSPNQCTNGPCPWHGNEVASAAVAALNNSIGAAGSGGTVARPFLFRTDLSENQILRCVKMCAAWGIDVLNMSFGVPVDSDIFGNTGEWDRTFQFAAENGVVMIAAAGNSTLDLPDDQDVRPATRTPGVLTVGALDGNNAGPRASSNYGSSVGIWAPGTRVPVAPDPTNTANPFSSGTSIAAPIVAGVAAMMRYANPLLSTWDIRRILVETGWQGNGRVTRGLDAYAAVFAAIQGTLPDNAEPNDTPATARDLIPVGPGGTLVPASGVFTTRSTATDRDYWRFRLDALSSVRVTVDWYQRLSALYVDVETDETEGRGTSELTRTGSANAGRQVLDGLLGPGTYRVRVSGTGATAYRLLVRVRRATLERDIFERNDSFEQAATLVFESRPWSPALSRQWGPGTYDATIHRSFFFSVLGGQAVTNVDYFRLEVPASSVFRRPTLVVSDADLPLDVTLYDESRTVIRSWPGVRNVTVLPPALSTCFLKVSSAAPTRYRIGTRLTVDRDAIPGPLQEEPLDIIPDWWTDPPALRVTKRVAHYAVDVNAPPGDGDAIAFARPAEQVQVQLLGRDGQVLREAEARDGRLMLDTANVERGTYVLRVARLEDETAQPELRLQQAPPLA